MFDHSRVGIAGTSLGAIVATLVYGVDSRVKKAVFMLGGGDLANILWTSSRVVTQREQLRKKGYTQDSMRTELAPIEPLNYIGMRPAGDTFVIGARYDTVIPVNDTRELIGKLNEPKVLWLDTGHYGGFFVQGRLLGTATDFFVKEFSGMAYVPPSHLAAPTLRLGAQLNSSTGLDIGGGIDLLKLNRQGTAAATFFITPRGAQVFVGQRIDRFISIGASFSFRRTSFGVMWSTVL
jgi:hypothetical protein